METTVSIYCVGGYLYMRFSAEDNFVVRYVSSRPMVTFFRDSQLQDQILTTNLPFCLCGQKCLPYNISKESVFPRNVQLISNNIIMDFESTYIMESNGIFYFYKTYDENGFNVVISTLPAVISKM